MKKFDDKMSPLPETPTVREAISWVRGLARYIGPGFHPDTPFCDYVQPDGKPSFTGEQCESLERELERAWKCLDAGGIDIYRVGLPMLKRMMRGGMDMER
jgi:hypothetical protein